MDEPTSSLTQDETNELFALIKTRNQGVGIIYIGHRMEGSLKSRSRHCFAGRNLYRTKIIKETSHDELITMIVGRSITNQFPYEEHLMMIQCWRLLTLTTAIEGYKFSLKAGKS